MSNIYEFIFYFLGGAVTGLYWFALRLTEAIQEK